MQFYDVKEKKPVEVPDSKCEKVIFKRETSKGTQERYAAKATLDGRKFMKFLNKESYDNLACKVAKAAPAKTPKAKKAAK